MKLAFCLFKYFPFGGLQRDFLRIAKICLARKHDVDVYTGSWQGEIPAALNLTIIPNRGFTNHSRYQSFSKRVQNIKLQDRYDAVVGFNKMAGLNYYFASDSCYGKKAREKNFLYRMGRRSKMLIEMERSVFGKESDTEILLISEREKKLFIQFYATPGHRFHLLPPGIDRGNLRPDNAHEINMGLRRELDIDPEMNIILMVGSGFKTKGLDRSILALSALPETLLKRTVLLVVGKDKAASFIRLAKRYGVSEHIRFLGGRDDVPRFLWAADLLIHPAYRENTGTVLIEAMAAGLPILATDVCGYSHYVEQSGAGLLIPSPFSQHHLNEKMTSMLSSPEKSWGESGMAYVFANDVFSQHEKAVNIIEQAGT